jgi:hypothetical protein
MNQHEWVQQCTSFYQNHGLTPGNPEDGDWEECHYPSPKKMGDKTILMLHDHHQVQGLLQSEEYNKMCFFSGDVKSFLIKGPFVENWFELWDLYEKHLAIHSSKNSVKLNSHPNTINSRREHAQTRAQKMLSHPNTLESQRLNAKKRGEELSVAVICSNTGTIYPSVAEASRCTGVSKSNIVKCCRQKRKSAGGLHWNYAEV